MFTPNHEKLVTMLPKSAMIIRPRCRMNPPQRACKVIAHQSTISELARNLGLDLPLPRSTKEQYDRMIAEGLGELDKSGIAELTFKDRHKHSGDRM